MISLPLCSCRGPEMPSGRYVCHSPTISAAYGASQEDCIRCKGKTCRHVANPVASHGLIRKTANLIVAGFKHLRAGLPRATREEHDRRLAICRACEHFEQGECRACGCCVTIKVWMAEQVCPVGKW